MDLTRDTDLQAYASSLTRRVCAAAAAAADAAAEVDGESLPANQFNNKFSILFSRSLLNCVLVVHDKLKRRIASKVADCVYVCVSVCV